MKLENYWRNSGHSGHSGQSGHSGLLIMGQTRINGFKWTILFARHRMSLLQHASGSCGTSYRKSLTARVCIDK
jgi:hypothetical protein